MCVILHALKKKHVTREEIAQAMRSNSAGFAMAALYPNGKRQLIRTLSQDDVFKFFDNQVKDEAEIVFHARIPSRGAKTLQNVHGWEEDKIIFMHNMTITSLDSLMTTDKWDGTDSEYFFRSIFMPLMKRFGNDAYKDGKLHPYIEKLVTVFIGSSNKFLFVMPDNNVLRFGSWVNEATRKEGDQIAFWASNTTYKPYKPAEPQSTSRNNRLYPRSLYPGSTIETLGDEDDWLPDNKGLVVYDGKNLIDIVGEARVARAGLLLYILANIAECQQIGLPGVVEGLYLPKINANEWPLRLITHVLSAGKYGVTDKVMLMANPCSLLPPQTPSTSVTETDLDTWFVKWAATLEEFLETSGDYYYPRTYHLGRLRIADLMTSLEERALMVLTNNNCWIDFNECDPARAIGAFLLTTSRKRRPTMMRLGWTDLITTRNQTNMTAYHMVCMLMRFIIDKSGVQSTKGGQSC